MPVRLSFTTEREAQWERRSHPGRGGDLTARAPWDDRSPGLTGAGPVSQVRKPAAFRPILGHPRSVESSKRDSERGRSRCEDESARGAALPEAKRLGVKGRSKLDKGQLKAAVDRRKYT